MRKVITGMMLLSAIIFWGVTSVCAANKETIETTAAYIGQYGVGVDVFCRNEVGLLEYFNLIVFDDTKLDYVSIEADRGALWYGTYPTHVDGNRIYVHGVGSPPTYCIPPDLGDPGSPLYHITFSVKAGAVAGLAALTFSSEGIWDGHWNDCSGYPVSPGPGYYDGGVDILGHAGHITIGSDSAGPGEQAVAYVYMHNDLDVFEYFNRLLFESAVAEVDSIVGLRGALHYGNYPTHVSGDTVYVHGWAAGDDCFYADHSYPGAPLYRIHLTLHEWAPPGYTMPLIYLGGDLVWDHWVGCDLSTTDLFTATDGSVYVKESAGIESRDNTAAECTLEQVSPNPATGGLLIRYSLSVADDVTLAIYGAAGKRVKTLTKGAQSAGTHHVTWDGTTWTGERAASGLYFCILRTATSTQAHKLVLTR